jgi:hypothetical protein
MGEGEIEFWPQANAALVYLAVYSANRKKSSLYPCVRFRSYSGPWWESPWPARRTVSSNSVFGGSEPILISASSVHSPLSFIRSTDPVAI